MALLPLLVFRMVILALTLYGFVDTGKRIWSVKRRFYDPLPTLLKRQFVALVKGTPETRALARRWFKQGFSYLLKRHGLALLPNVLLLLLLVTINMLAFTLLQVDTS